MIFCNAFKTKEEATEKYPGKYCDSCNENHYENGIEACKKITEAVEKQIKGGNNNDN